MGLLEKRPYRHPGQRERSGYVLTRAGMDFMPVIRSMFDWGSRHLPHAGRLKLTHLACGADAHVEIACAEGHSVPLSELGLRLAEKPERQ